MKKIIFNWGVKGLGIILLIVLLKRVDFQVLLQVLRRFDWYDIFILEMASVAVILTKALRFQLLGRRFDVRLPFFPSVIVYGSGMFLSTITPGRIGDFAKIFYLKNATGCSYQKGFYLSIVDRLFDLLMISIFALLGLAQIIPWHTIIVSISVLLVLIVMLVYFFRTPIWNGSKQLLTRLGRQIKVDFSDLKPSDLISMKLVLPLCFSLIPNGLIFGQMIFINQTSQITMPVIETVGILALANLISMLPITISGLGTRDATFVYLLGKKGIDSALALSLSLSFFVFNNLGILLVGLILFLIFKPQIHESTTPQPS